MSTDSADRGGERSDARIIEDFKIATQGPISMPPADTDRERPQTVGEALHKTVGLLIPQGVDARHFVAPIFAALNLDPATVLDGPLVVLHPGESVVVLPKNGRLLDEIDRLRAEVARLTPVVEAAVAWREAGAGLANETYRGRLAAAVDALTTPQPEEGGK